MNGVDGLYLFPVTKTISYVIRNNKECCQNMPRSDRAFDVFVVLGSHPTQYVFDHGFFYMSADSYDDACQFIDAAVENVLSLEGVFTQGS
jgi:hypothetical protein